MKERPILFSAPMVRALLDGSKTQTRRVVKPQPSADHNWAGWCTSSTHRADEGKAVWAVGEGPQLRDAHRVRCPYGQPGDRLWVRETWRGVVSINPPGAAPEYGVARYIPDQDQCRRVEYAATQDRGGEPWRPSIHMPRWASRILLEIVSVRVERLQAITEADARAEGIRDGGCTSCGKPEPCGCANPAPDARDAYCHLWGQINGPDAWAENPWVWVIEFRRVTP